MDYIKPYKLFEAQTNEDWEVYDIMTDFFDEFIILSQNILQKIQNYIIYQFLV